MPDEAGEIAANLNSHASRVLPPIGQALAEQLHVEDDATQVGAIDHALMKAFMAGAHVGQIEVVAQVLEQAPNVNVEHRVVGGPDESTSFDG